MKKKFIVILTMAIFTCGSVSASAADLAQKNEGLKIADTGELKISKTSSVSDQQLLIESLKDADFEKLEYYIALFAKYSDEDINSLTANEILDYINLYGSYTGKDLISELGLEEVKDNIDSFGDLTNFEDILYEAEDYYGYSADSDTSSSTDDSDNDDSSKGPANNASDKIPNKPGNKNEGSESLNKDKHKNWGDDKKLQVDNFSFENDIITQFKDFFTKCYTEYLNGNLSIEQILNSIINGDYSEIKDTLGTVIDNSDSTSSQGSNVKDDVFAGNNVNNKFENNNSINMEPGKIESNKDNLDKGNVSEESSNKNVSTGNTQASASTSSDDTSSKTSDTSNLLMIASGVVGLLGIIKKRR